jgi:hypothetical protein
LSQRWSERCWPVVWLAATAAITWSVVRFELLIVAVLTLATGALAWTLARGLALRLDGRWPVPQTLLGAAVATELVPSFTYASRTAHRGVLHVLAGTCLVVAAAWLAGGRLRLAVPWLAAAGYLVAAVWVIRADPSPRIDVWVILQQASDGLSHGANAYTSVWTGSPGERDAFTYLPWTLVLLAPGRWLFGDVRWGLVAWTLVGAGATLALGRWRPATAAGSAAAATSAAAGSASAALLLLTPGTSTPFEQAWTEPLLLALLAIWALLVGRGRAWWAVLPLALALASKQHMVLLLPLLAVWPAFGWRRTAVSGGLAGVLVLPWFLAAPAAMWHDTVTLLVGFHPILFADTLYLASMHELGAEPPFWATGLVVVVTIALATAAIGRRRPGLDQVLRWSALVLLVANLVNKQAFYNQYWLVAGLVLLSVAAARDRSLPGQRGQVGQPGLGEAGLGDPEDRPERGRRRHVG